MLLASRIYTSALHLPLQIGFVVGTLYFVGWQPIAAYAVARLVAATLRVPIEFTTSGKMARDCGHHLTASERNFLRAYFFYAARHRTSLDVGIDAVELDPEAYDAVSVHLAHRMPDQFSRFSEA